jgi:hypothetical protein
MLIAKVDMGNDIYKWWHWSCLSVWLSVWGGLYWFFYVLIYITKHNVYWMKTKIKIMNTILYDLQNAIWFVLVVAIQLKAPAQTGDFNGITLMNVWLLLIRVMLTHTNDKILDKAVLRFVCWRRNWRRK